MRGRESADSVHIQLSLGTVFTNASGWPDFHLLMIFPLCSGYMEGCCPVFIREDVCTNFHKQRFHPCLAFIIYTREDPALHYFCCNI